MRVSTLVLIPFTLYSLPLLGWWLMRIELASRVYVDPYAVSRDAWQASLICHLLYLVMVIPVLVRGHWRQCWQGIIAVISLPLIFWMLLIQIGALTITTVLNCIAGLLLIAIIFWVAIGLLKFFVNDNGIRGLLVLVLQIGSVVVLLSFRQVWMSWMGV